MPKHRLCTRCDWFSKNVGKPGKGRGHASCPNVVLNRLGNIFFCKMKGHPLANYSRNLKAFRMGGIPVAREVKECLDP